MIYFVQCGKNGPIKIGCAANVEDRVAQIQTSCPYELKLLWKIDGGMNKEAEIHERWKHEKIRGEWFRPSRSLLNFINGEAANEWEVQVEKSSIAISETRNEVNVDGVTWSMLEMKESHDLHLTYYQGVHLAVELEMKCGCKDWTIDLFKDGIRISQNVYHPNNENLWIHCRGEKTVIENNG